MSGSSMSKDADKLQSIRQGLQYMRSTKRRTVVWPATFYVREYEFRATLYDISIGGIRLKLPLPLAKGTEASIKVKNKVTMNVKVVWCAGEFMGLKFSDPDDIIRSALRELSVVFE